MSQGKQLLRETTSPRSKRGRHLSRLSGIHQRLDSAPESGPFAISEELEGRLLDQDLSPQQQEIMSEMDRLTQTD